MYINHYDLCNWLAIVKFNSIYCSYPILSHIFQTQIEEQIYSQLAIAKQLYACQNSKNDHQLYIYTYIIQLVKAQLQYLYISTHHAVATFRIYSQLAIQLYSHSIVLIVRQQINCVNEILKGSQPADYIYSLHRSHLASYEVSVQLYIDVDIYSYVQSIQLQL